MREINDILLKLKYAGTHWQSVFTGGWPYIVLILAFTALAFAEFRRPKLNRQHAQMLASYRVNLGLFVVNSLIVSLFSLAGLMLVLDHFSGKGWLHGTPDSGWKGVGAFLLLDFLLYAWHRICHRFDSLWMFHKVHHSDPNLNVSTAFRIHIAELILTTLLKSVYIILLGIDKTVVFAYETVYPLFVMFHHTNISFSGEKWLGQVLVTPQLHRTHHAVERQQHDSNYGAIFSIWDRLLLTRQEQEPAGIGIRGESPKTVWGLVKFGFIPGAQPASAPVPVPAGARAISLNIHAMIAEAAYYKAEKRAFSPGHELYDWLEAKKEILKQVYGDRCMNC
ncbi:MAG: sterol desaturase family protein [Gammaproteobacteria bacterium]